jgi:hypothetical protein
MKKFIISEEEKNRILSLHEQNWFLDKIKSEKDKFFAFYENIKNVLKGNIKMYKEIIPNIAKEYYSKDTVKEDAFRHILASAFFTTTIGEKLTYFGGEVNEILGALRSFLKGEGFDSGWVMDTNNNEIGIEIGKKNPKANINQLSDIVKKSIDSGNFYTKKGILYRDDPNPEK